MIKFVLSSNIVFTTWYNFILNFIIEYHQMNAFLIWNELINRLVGTYSSDWIKISLFHATHLNS